MRSESTISNNNKNRLKRCRSRSFVRSRKRRGKFHERTETVQDITLHDNKWHNTNKNQYDNVTVFEQYILAQGCIVSPLEQSIFFLTLNRPLPICFRIRSISSSNKIINEWKNFKIS